MSAPRPGEEFFAPFIDQLVGQVRGRHGSFLTMGFGAPQEQAEGNGGVPAPGSHYARRCRATS